MKKLFTFLFVVMAFCETSAQQSPFVRVYDLQGTKIHSGRVLSAAENTLQLKGRGGQIPINTIGSIKVGRTAGRNVWMGALAGGSILGLITALGSDYDPNAILSFTPAEAAVIGFVFGLPVGAAAGGITALFKKPNVFIIDGDVKQWKEFQSFIDTKKEIIKNE